MPSSPSARVKPSAAAFSTAIIGSAGKTSFRCCTMPLATGTLDNPSHEKQMPCPWHGYNRGVKVPTSDSEQEPTPKQRNGRQRRSIIVTSSFLAPRASAPSGHHHIAMKLQAQGVSVQTDALYSTQDQSLPRMHACFTCSGLWRGTQRTPHA